MKIAKFASIALAVLCGASVLSCHKIGNEEDNGAEEKVVTFTVALNSGTVTSDYAEVIVRHDGKDSDTWYGFLTQDLTTEVSELVKAQLPNVTKDNLHVGTVQTVALSNLEEHKDYKYIAFGVNESKELFGEPGVLAFTTDGDLAKAVFTIELKDLTAHSVVAAVSHAGYDEYTWYGFITSDLTTAATTLLSAAASGLEAEELYTGTAKELTFEDLADETSYRVIAGGIKEGGVLYGTLADEKFETPIDLNLVEFNAAVNGVTKNSATVAVSYSAEAELTWYGFTTTDTEAKAEDLVAAAVAGITEADWKTGAQSVELENLTPETPYRYIVTGINADGAFGVPADAAFETLTDAYDSCVFTVEASDVTATTATLTITHTGKEDFEYGYFVTEDLETALADVALPENIDENLLTGLETTVPLTDLNPETTYRVIVVGRVNGSEYGNRGETNVTTTAVTYAVDSNWTVTYDGFVDGKDYPEQVTNTAAVPGISGKYLFISVPKSSLEGATAEAFYEEAVAPYVQQQLQAAIAAGQSLDDILLEDTATDYLSAFEYETDYLVYAAGATSGGYPSGHFAYVELNKPDNALKLSYEDYLGEWKIDGNVWEVVEKVSGSTYTIKGIPGSTAMANRGGVTEIEAVYDAERGKLYAMEQVLSVYNDPSTNNYGELTDLFSGYFEYNGTAYPNYPTNSDDPAKVFTLVAYSDTQFELRAGSSENGTFTKFQFRWIINTGEYAGRGNVYGTAIALPTTAIEKVVKVKASYEDFLGEWVVGEETWVLSQNVAGQSYFLSGPVALSTAYAADDNSLPVVTYDAANGQIYVMEQSLGGVWQNTNYGGCEDYLSGIFSHGTSQYAAYPTNTDNPEKIFTGYFDENGKVQLLAGSCSYGTFIGLGASWCILEGENAGAGNKYNAWSDLPAVMEKAEQGSAAYNQWLGSWSIPSIEYQYDSNDEYTGDAEGTSTFVIRQAKANESYKIKGIGPKNETYEVAATFDPSNNTLVVTPQVVSTWTYTAQNMEINECLVGLYTSGGDEMLTWNNATTLFTATLSGNTASLTPGKTADGDTFTGFQFYQRQGSDGGYGYGGYYVLPNTLTKANASAPKKAVRGPQPLKLNKSFSAGVASRPFISSAKAVKANAATKATKLSYKASK